MINNIEENWNNLKNFFKKKEKWFILIENITNKTIISGFPFIVFQVKIYNVSIFSNQLTKRLKKPNILISKKKIKIKGDKIPINKICQFLIFTMIEKKYKPEEIIFQNEKIVKEIKSLFERLDKNNFLGVKISEILFDKDEEMEDDINEENNQEENQEDESIEIMAKNEEKLLDQLNNQKLENISLDETETFKGITLKFLQKEQPLNDLPKKLPTKRKFLKKKFIIAIFLFIYLIYFFILVPQV